MTKVEAALRAAKIGPVFPLKPGAKAPPLLTNWPQRATTDEADIRQYWLPLPDANIGLHCAGMLVIDADVAKGGIKSLEGLYSAEKLPSTLTTITPSGGRHLFFRLPPGHRGVPNSVGVLAPGLDVRSTGGYVVAPGSEVAAGRYVFEHPDVEIAEAPQWLIDQLGVVRERGSSVDKIVSDAPDVVLDRARAWLLTAERSVKGSGGDQAAYRVAARLRDFGVSYAQACELMRSAAWDYGCGWRDNRLEEKPIRSAYRYATGEPGSKAALPEDFPEIVPEKGTIVPKLGTKALLSLSAFASQAARTAGYVVKGMLQRRSYAEIYGAPGEGKTFVALDLGYHVAAGKPWMGLKVHAGPVAYLAYEGTGGMVKRAQALRQKYGDKDVPLYIISAAYNLREKTGRAELGATLAMLPTRPVLIVIDTFARALMGGDENSAQDVGAFNSAIAALIESTGVCALILHHSGKDKTKGARGSSALRGALDTEIEIDGQQIYARKQRDVEVLPAIGFKLAPVMVGLDEDGDEVTSCVVEPAAIPVQGSTRITGQAKMGFEVLCGLAPNNEPVDVKEWKEACREFLGGKGVNGAFFRIKQKLLQTGHVAALEDGRIERRMT